MDAAGLAKEKLDEATGRQEGYNLLINETTETLGSSEIKRM